MATPARPSAKSFENFDDPDVFKNSQKLAKSHETQNFVIDFNEHQALCAFNLDRHDFEDALSKRSAESNEVRATKRQATCSDIIVQGKSTEDYTLDVRITLIPSSPAETKVQRNIWCPEKQKDVIKVSDILGILIPIPNSS